MLIKARCLYVLNKEDNNLNYLLDKIKHIPEIFDDFFNKKIDDFNREEILFLKSLPINTIIAKEINNNKTYFCLPFFSSHIKSPIKSGEFVWLFPFEEKHANNSQYKITAYWLTRVHGLIMSEDVNYCYNDRDFIQRFNDKTIEEEIKDIQQNPALKKNYIEGNTFYDKNFLVLPTTDMIGSKTNRNILRQYSQLIKKPISKFDFENDDTVIQGSFNNTIVMSKNKDKKSANIDIVVGRKNEFRKNVEEDNNFYKLLTVKNNSLIKDVLTEVNLEENIVFNGIHYETLKYPEKYVNIKNKKFKTTNENTKFSDDASRIFISELDNIDANILDQYTVKTKILDKNNISKNENSFYTDDFLELKSFIKKINTIQNQVYDSPCIGIISNEIRLVSKKGITGANDTSDGSIKLIKASNNQKNKASISLENDGQINIDSELIKIGNNKSLIILGNSNELNHAVLGDNLKEILFQLISLNKQSLSIIADFIKNDEKHTHNILLSSLKVVNVPTNAIMPFAITSDGLPFKTTEGVLNIINNTTADNNINSKSEIQNKLSSLISSLDNILSKFVMNS